MAAPSIGSVVTSLMNCKLDGRKGESQLYHTPAAESEIDEVTVELNSDSAFLNHWEQCLDMKTGKVFYANWENGGRTTEDPRLASSIMGPSYCSSEGSNSDYDTIDDEEEEDTDGDVEDCSSFAGDITDYESDTRSNSSSSCSRSSPSNSDTCSEGGGAGVLILVVAGCKSCFMYFMVPKGVDACPKCGGCLLHLGSN